MHFPPLRFDRSLTSYKCKENKTDVNLPPRFFLFFGADDAVTADDFDAVLLTPLAAGMSAILL